MSELSFDIKTSKDFFQKLKDDYSDFLKEKTSSRIAINCAMTSWHLSEWLYEEFKETLFVSFSDFQAFRKNLKEQCPSLQIMHDIANGSKHYHLNSHKPQIEGTELHRGSFNKSFNRSFDISSLDIEMKNGTKIYFEDEIKKVMQFWQKYLTDYRII